MNSTYKNTLTALEAFKSIGANIPQDEAHTFLGFRKLANEAFKTLKEMVNFHNDEKAKMEGIYADKYIENKTAQFKAEENNLIAETKAGLSSLLESLYKVKADRLAEYTMTPPSDEILRLLTALNMRTGKISEGEFKMLLEKCADNYQALSAVKSLADKNGFDLLMPVDVEAYQDELNSVYEDLKGRINLFGAEADMNYKGAELYGYGNETMTYLTARLNDLDENTAFKIEKPQLTRYELLNDELEKAKAEKNYKKGLKILDLMKNRADDILTAEEKQAIKEKELDESIRDAITYSNNGGME